MTNKTGAALAAFLLLMFSGTVFVGVKFGIHIKFMLHNIDGPKGAREEFFPSNMQQEIVTLSV